jgi:hypothetical protein
LPSIAIPVTVVAGTATRSGEGWRRSQNGHSSESGNTKETLEFREIKHENK